MRVLLGLSILLMLPLACRAESCANGVQANGETVELPGLFHSDVIWGPPNFGEDPQNDSQFIAWFIALSEPLVVQGGVEVGGNYYSSVSEIKLSSDFTQFKGKLLEPLAGKLVVVTGRLWRGTVEGDVTPIVIAAKTVTATDQNICRVTRAN